MLGKAVLTLLVFLSVLTPSASANQVAGLNAHLMWTSVSAAEQDRQLGLIAAAGGRMARVDVGWTSLEQAGKGQYDSWYLGRLDALVATAESRGVELLFTLTDSPCWASSAPESEKQGCQGEWWDRDVQRYTPTNPRDYADALAFLVGRYGDRVAAWEVWNEPNLSFYFKADNPPQAYTDIVRAAYPAAKAANPSATVVVGSLAESPADFTEKLLDYGIGGYFDAFSVHPYSGDASPLAPQSDKWIQTSFARGVPNLRELLLRYGQDKPIWLTEFGWSTTTVRGLQPWENGVDELTQALYIEQALVKVRDWPYVPVALVYGVVDRGTDPGFRNHNFGLVRYDGSPKPAYAAFQRGAGKLAGLIPIEPRDVEVPVDPGDEEPGEDEDEVDSTTRRLTLGIVRKGRRFYARGRAEPRARIQLRGRRYLRAKRRFARRAMWTLRVRASERGRYKLRFDSRLGAGGRWQLTASYARSPRSVRALATVRSGRKR